MSLFMCSLECYNLLSGEGLLIRGLASSHRCGPLICPLKILSSFWFFYPWSRMVPKSRSPEAKLAGGTGVTILHQRTRDTSSAVRSQPSLFWFVSCLTLQNITVLNHGLISVTQNSYKLIFTRLENRVWFQGKNRGENLCRGTCKSSPGSCDESSFHSLAYGILLAR